jgi:hypothetical protein
MKLTTSLFTLILSTLALLAQPGPPLQRNPWTTNPPSTKVSGANLADGSVDILQLSTAVKNGLSPSSINGLDVGWVNVRDTNNNLIFKADGTNRMVTISNLTVTGTVTGLKDIPPSALAPETLGLLGNTNGMVSGAFGFAQVIFTNSTVGYGVFHPSLPQNVEYTVMPFSGFMSFSNYNSAAYFTPSALTPYGFTLTASAAYKGAIPCMALGDRLIISGRGFYANDMATPSYYGGNARVGRRSPTPLSSLMLMFDGYATNYLVACAIEYPASTYTRVTFNGETNVNVAASSQVKSDIINITIPANSTYWIRTFVTNSGGGWPLTANGLLSGLGGGVLYATTTSFSDLSMGGSIPDSVDSYGWIGPTAVLGTSETGGLSYGAIGDSIVNGIGDSPQTFGFAARAFGSTNASITVGFPGLNAYQFVGTNFNNTWATPTTEYVRHCDVIICEFGINDCSNGQTVSQLQTNLLLIWNYYASRGKRVYQTTITPKTTSTDSWSTVVNQTVDSGNAVRVAVNNWIRGNPAPLTGYIEIADTIESARDSGKWKAGYCYNDGLGVHPNSTATTFMATGLASVLFP